MSDAFAEDRQRMVAAQLAARGIADGRVLEAMRRVPRHLFVDPSLHAHAYEDTPLPIGARQTISQPYMVALMSEEDLQGPVRIGSHTDGIAEEYLGDCRFVKLRGSYGWEEP